MNCLRCGKNNALYLMNGLYQDCWNLQYAPFYENHNWYECPDCHGKFTQPTNTCDLKWICPFCSKEMKGYKL